MHHMPQSVALVKLQRRSDQPRLERGVSDGRHKVEVVVLSEFVSFLINYIPTVRKAIVCPNPLVLPISTFDSVGWQILDKLVEHYLDRSGFHWRSQDFQIGYAEFFVCSISIMDMKVVPNNLLTL